MDASSSMPGDIVQQIYNSSWMACSCVAAPSRFATIPMERDLLMDTGCGYNLADSECAAFMPWAMCASQFPVTLHIANSLTQADKERCAFIEQLAECITMLILPDTSTVLSIGLRCCEHGYGFDWPPFGDPV